MTFRQQSVPYPHWEFVHPGSGDRLRVVPERGGLVTEWLCNGREVLYFDQERFADPAKSIRGGIPVLFPVWFSAPHPSCWKTWTTGSLAPFLLPPNPKQSSQNSILKLP